MANLVFPAHSAPNVSIWAIPLRQAFRQAQDTAQDGAPDPGMFSAYFTQLKAYLETRLHVERPLLPAPTLVCLAPHLGPILVLANNPYFKRMVEQVASQGPPGFPTQVRGMLEQLFADELMRPEQARRRNLERLRQDLPRAEEWAILARPEE